MQAITVALVYLTTVIGGLIAESPKVRVSIETNFGGDSDPEYLRNSHFDNEMANCGRTLEGSMPIGLFPWFAKIYVSKFNGLAFRCGGTLITKDLILTSAACLKTKADMNHPENLLIFLGKSNFLNFKGPIQIRMVSRLNLRWM